MTTINGTETQTVPSTDKGNFRPGLGIANASLLVLAGTTSWKLVLALAHFNQRTASLLIGKFVH
ncbi:hypothetical protein Pan216_27880 [Planctomycetes bacterium Pan216]|uniref:Uncharacterized protein n=1 Tax=Kolteria novifilia TaxID=2527975 RepID=A0A518B4L0_9BACT|nr:hypothetical protein Pan216_27880 [Planctomycetes bacterium Pan216]